MTGWKVSELGEPAQVMRLLDLSVPQPEAGQLLVRVVGAAANFPDVLMRRGLDGLCKLVADGTVRPLVSERLALEEVADGLQRLAGGLQRLADGATVGRVAYVP
ncbi:MAG: hypothetical protein ABI903_04715 [Actinomycetota bacterium]